MLHRWGLLALLPLSLILLVACGLPASTLPDGAVIATATASNCGCFLYSSYPHGDYYTATATPTGTWATQTPTPRPTPTRPPAGCDYCTLPPAPTRTVPAWPSPIITCTPSADQPTSSPVPTEPPALFPTFPPNTPLPAMIGNSAPYALANMEGEGLPGGVAISPLTGRNVAIWTQVNLDFPDQGRVYVQRQGPPAGNWLPARTINPPGLNLGGAPESAIGINRAGVLYAAYTHVTGGGAVIDWTRSTDDGASWSPPATFGERSPSAIYNLRLVIDRAGLPHIGAIATVVDDPASPSGDVLYFELQADGSWRHERRPLQGRGGRQHNMALAVQGADPVRTILALDDDQVVYSGFKDGSGGAWQQVGPLIDGQSQPYGIRDYLPGGLDHSMRLTPFTDTAGQAWTYLFYSLYSTGRICYFYSRDGGATWSGEDALAYFPIPGGGPPPLVNGTVHGPSPFYDAAHNKVFVLYQYADRTYPDGGGQFPVFAYSDPGADHGGWSRFADPLHEPVRLFRSTRFNAADRLRISEPPGEITSAGAPAALLWREATGQREIYFAQLWPATLLSLTP